MGGTGAAWGISFSPRTELAINGAVALASRKRREVGAARVAREVGTAKASLSNVLNDLKRAGLIRWDGNGSAAWGRRRPADVSLYDIAAAVGERFRVRCHMKGSDASAGLCRRCPIKCLSKPLRSEVVQLFKARRLSDLMPTGS